MSFTGVAACLDVGPMQHARLRHVGSVDVTAAATVSDALAGQMENVLHGRQGLPLKRKSLHAQGQTGFLGIFGGSQAVNALNVV